MQSCSHAAHVGKTFQGGSSSSVYSCGCGLMVVDLATGRSTSMDKCLSLSLQQLQNLLHAELSEAPSRCLFRFLDGFFRMPDRSFLRRRPFTCGGSPDASQFVVALVTPPATAQR
jgi:hypothetical protein